MASISDKETRRDDETATSLLPVSQRRSSATFIFMTALPNSVQLTISHPPATTSQPPSRKCLLRSLAHLMVLFFTRVMLLITRRGKKKKKAARRASRRRRHAQHVVHLNTCQPFSGLIVQFDAIVAINVHSIFRRTLQEKKKKKSPLRWRTGGHRGNDAEQFNVTFADGCQSNK